MNKESRFSSGAIVRYPYLWRWQSDKGREHGEKDRPVCLAMALPDPRQKLTHLVILAISGTSPLDEQSAIEIPSLEIRRAGLREHKRAWLTIGEYNYDVLERSYNFDPAQEPQGRFSDKFLLEIQRTLRPLLQAARGRIDRTR
ncbi:hypothetical protein AB4Y96_15940 [Phyllobacterium sp. TAF24]|uniref:hypothetical protein n=1 Tax=Phyllobacterium sp. TAF24 TaxID=3233068 RepID=UPI003F9B24AF